MNPAQLQMLCYRAKVNNPPRIQSLFHPQVLQHQTSRMHIQEVAGQEPSMLKKQLSFSLFHLESKVSDCAAAFFCWAKGF